MISFSESGSFDNIEAYLRSKTRLNARAAIEQYAQRGVAALSANTPSDSGLAARSWGYRIEEEPGYFAIIWTNSDVETGFPVAVMLQYGYGTGTGGYVQGRDYINPAMKPIFDEISRGVWKLVKST